jgi:hypothetical protein
MQSLVVKQKQSTINIPWRHMGELKYRPIILDLKTRWRWVVSYTPRPLYSRGIDIIPNGQEAGWALEPVWAHWGTEKSCHDWNRIRIVQPVASLYTDWANPASKVR